MTNHWTDYQNTDVFMVLGTNPAENHPISMRWIDRARETRGAKLIVVDPKFNRTAAKADLYVPIRPGTDIAFLGGLMNYALTHGRYFHEYVAKYTNASYLIHPDFKFEEGLFSGAQVGEDGQVKYDTATWQYQVDEDGNIKKDPTLQHPQCVFQLMKKHYARYTPEMVAETCGMTVEEFLEVAELFTSTGRPDKAGNIMYAMGITQSSHGSQNVRAVAMLQLLLGNIGIPGGGVNAHRGESNVQGSTDMAMLWNNLPGYMPMPSAAQHPTLAAYQASTPKSGYWTNRPKFMVSLLKAWWGENATAENDFAYDYLPKLDHRDHSHMSIFEAMGRGELKGLFAWGQNFAVGGPNVTKERSALANLDWLVVVDLFETETAAFWKGPGMNPAEIQTEVFLLPAAASYEKCGTVTNSGRWIQWRDKAVEPMGDSRDDLWIADRLFKKLRELYATEGGAFPDPILQLHWDYDDGDHPSAEKVAFEINGYTWADRKGLTTFGNLQDDGSTACGCWIYAGYFDNFETPKCRSRVKDEPGTTLGTHLGWAWAWPVNRRILYNRCSMDEHGQPWDPERPLFRWDGEKFIAQDVPDFVATNPPEVSAQNPFIMMQEGVGALWSPSGMKDGPIPEHYEPVESPVSNRFNRRQFNPVAVISGKGEFGALTEAENPEFPYICTTYRVTEHWQSGAMTRSLPWLGEMMPDMFVEISPTLAAKLGVQSGDRVEVTTVRGSLVAPAMVTPRMRPVRVHGREIEIVGMPWHWGFMGKFTGASANVLTPHVGDANTQIPEYKAFLCNVKKAGGSGPVRG